MSELLIGRNYLAKVDLKAGQFIANVASQDPVAPQCQPAGLTVEKIQVLGVNLRDTPAGEPVTFEPFITGRMVQLRAGAAVEAGVPIGIDANGDAVAAGAGTAAAPMWSVEPAAAAGDMFLAVIVHTCGLI